MCIIALLTMKIFRYPWSPFPLPALMEALEPKENSTDQGEIPAPHPPCCNGVCHSIIFNFSHLLSKPYKIGALASSGVTSKAKNGQLKWVLFIIPYIKASDICTSFNEKIMISPVTCRILYWPDNCTHPYTSMNLGASLVLHDADPVLHLQKFTTTPATGRAETSNKWVLPELLVMAHLLAMPRNSMWYSHVWHSRRKGLCKCCD